jgi:hypothetical protein
MWQCNKQHYAAACPTPSAAILLLCTMLILPMRCAYGPCSLPGGNPDSNTLISDMTTVICLDDYHCLDRKGRAEKGVTALAPEAQNFDMMYEQVRQTQRRTTADVLCGC